MRRPHLTAALCLLTLLGATGACETSTDADELTGTHRSLDAEEVFGPLAPGEVLELVDNEDGTVSYALSPESALEQDTLVTAGFVTWRYVGQAHFPAEHMQVDEIQPYEVVEETNTTTDEQLATMVRVDNRGRRWVVEHYDEQALAEAVAAYDAAGEEEPDRPEEFPEALAGIQNPDHTPPLGTWVDFEPHTWTHFTCPAEGGAPEIRTHMWEGEDRTTVLTHTFQEEAAVKIFTLRDGARPTATTARLGHCSGVMIDDSHVLTAAHCVSNARNFDLQANRVQVCLSTSGSCTDSFSGTPLGVGPLPPFSDSSPSGRTVVAIDRPANYNGGSDTTMGIDWDDDWAIVTLSGPFSNRSLRLSGLSNRGIRALTRTRSFGYPAQRRDPSPSGCDETLSRLQRVTEIESPSSTTTKKVRHRSDATAGQSGAPMYYCPHRDNSRCNEHPRETGFVYGVHSGWNGFNLHVVGPKVPNFRAAALAMIEG
ncbi:MAG: trypsin-like serine peptidase [Nannocystales bacterium]